MRFYSVLESWPVAHSFCARTTLKKGQWYNAPLSVHINNTFMKFYTLHWELELAWERFFKSQKKGKGKNIHFRLSIECTATRVNVAIFVTHPSNTWKSITIMYSPSFLTFLVIEPFVVAFYMKGVRVIIHCMKESSRSFPLHWIISTVDIKLLSRQTGMPYVSPEAGGQL